MQYVHSSIMHLVAQALMKKAFPVESFKLFVFFCGFNPNILLSEHTPGPDTRFSPAGLTGDGRNLDLLVLRAYWLRG
jgi:hypothetical protein